MSCPNLQVLHCATPHLDTKYDSCVSDWSTESLGTDISDIGCVEHFSALRLYLLLLPFSHPVTLGSWVLAGVVLTNRLRNLYPELEMFVFCLESC